MVARHRNCPNDTAMELSRDAIARVWIPALSNPVLTTEQLRHIIKRDHRRDHTGILDNPNCPAEALEQLSQDGDWRVRERVAGNPQCPPQILVRLWKDPDGAVRQAVAVHPNWTEEYRALAHLLD
jgi:hypothetical protein